MQVIWESKDERGTNRETDPMGAVLHVERVSRCVEGKYVGGTRSRRTRIRDNRGIFSRDQERVWRREERIGKSGKTEEVRIRREDNGRICSRIQEGSKGKWV